MQVWGVGEILWDIFPDEERLGGAPCNFCANLQRLGDAAMLLSAVGRDQRGEAALARMAHLNLNTRYIQTVEGAPTGTALIHTNLIGEASFSIPRPAAFDLLSISTEDNLDTSAMDWLYFGTLMQTEPAIERLTTRLAKALPSGRCFYDVNLRGSHWNFPLVERLSRLTSILKLNREEAETIFRVAHDSSRFSLEEFSGTWTTTYGVDLVCVTLGAAGVFVFHDGVAHRIAGYRVPVLDTVGAGDAFSAAFLHGYQRGWAIEYTARFANALGALVASRAGATPDWTIDECQALMEEQRFVDAVQT
jgi:fructokinase